MGKLLLRKYPGNTILLKRPFFLKRIVFNIKKKQYSTLKMGGVRKVGRIQKKKK